ncbi:MAG: deoxyribose-phosphate aldolase [Synergistaceae bacterium]|jgi:deoxyribose-phosphate aldolase|nr:deoxyribose-phosphate aldolase [Synergistaceae bacterium]
MVNLAKMDKWALGKHFDHSVLPKNTTEDDIRKGCREAVKYNCAAFYSATPFWTPVVVEELKGSDVLPATGIDFPFGASPGAVKAFEAEYAVKAGCKALDTVLNIGALKDRKHDVVKQELKDFKAAAGDALTKVILEVAFLTDEEIATACKLVAEVGCDYAKTSTGQFEGPSMEQFLVMKRTLVGTPVKLKVAGVKFPRPQNAYAFILAGAELIGTRAAVAIIEALDTMREIGLVPPYEG